MLAIASCFTQMFLLLHRWIFCVFVSIHYILLELTAQGVIHSSQSTIQTGFFTIYFVKSLLFDS